MTTKTLSDEERLDAARAKGPLATLGLYTKLSGPGFLQSALTLGGGSLAGSLFLGVIGGYSMLWVQLVAIILGAIMLAAIGYVTLSIERSPFDGMRRHINPALAWGWLLGALFANMIWALPQYALAYAALTENLFPDLVPNPDSLGSKVVVTLILGALVTGATLFYGKGRGVRVYETLLKCLVAIIVLSFFGVVVRLAVGGDLPWGEIARGFIPNLGHLVEPAGQFASVLQSIEDESVRAWWSERIVDTQRDRMIASASAAVGINMTFLMPFALLARGWGRKFRGVAEFDLGLGMVLPFILATGCVVIVAASQFHVQSWEGVRVLPDGAPEMVEGANADTFAELTASLDSRTAAIPDVPTSAEEIEVAGMLLPRTNDELAFSLEGLFGNALVAQKIFGVGVLAMALSTISLLMLVSGFALCEATGRPHGGRTHQLGTLFAAFGLLWPFLWTGASRAYLAITIGTIGYTLLPLALFSFLFMLNSKRLLGDEMPRGRKRVAWNVLMGGALLITGSASIWTAWNKELFGFPIGKVLLFVIGSAVVAGHFYLRSRLSSQAPPPDDRSGGSAA